MLTAIETTATVNDEHQLVLDDALPLAPRERVKVIVLVRSADEDAEQGQQSTPAPVYRRAGSAAGQIKMSADFNAPLDDFKEYQP